MCIRDRFIPKPDCALWKCDFNLIFSKGFLYYPQSLILDAVPVSRWCPDPYNDINSIIPEIVHKDLRCRVLQGKGICFNNVLYYIYSLISIAFVFNSNNVFKPPGSICNKICDCISKDLFIRYSNIQSIKRSNCGRDYTYIFYNPK